SVARADPHAHVGVGEDGRAGGHHDVADEGDVRPEAHGIAVDGGDDGLVAVEDVVDDPTGLHHHVPATPARCLAAGEVAPGAEGAAGARHHEDLALAVVVEVAGQPR